MSETLGIESQRREGQLDLGWAVRGHHVLEIVHIEKTYVSTEKPTTWITPKKGVFLFHHLKKNLVTSSVFY